MKQILKIKMVREIDEYPDFSWLGRYSNKYEPGAINRPRFSKRYHYGEYEWFVQDNHWPHDPKSWNHVSEEDKAEVIREYRTLKRADWCYALQDMHRLDDLGETWNPIGIYAKAEIVVENVIQHVRSGGLYGLASDDDDDYLDMVEGEELDNLVMVLKELGFTESEIGKVEVEK